jgi:aspartokinase/homoserine dehydrogenase 1
MRKIKEKIAIVVSARGNTTDELDDILICKKELQTLKFFYQRWFEGVDFRLNLKLDKLFEGVSLMAIIAIRLRIKYWHRAKCSRQMLVFC